MNQTDYAKIHLVGIFKRLTRLLSFGIQPIIVFVIIIQIIIFIIIFFVLLIKDGPAPALKR